MSSFPLTETTYGFKWGPVSVERLASEDKFGVVLLIETERGRLEVRVTPSGLIRNGDVTKKTRKTRKP